MAGQPDISSILAALAQQQSNGIPQQSQSQPPPPGYPSAGIPAQPPSAPPQGAPYLPQPSHTGSVDLSAIKPVSSGSVSIADAIAKARSLAADRGVSSYEPRPSSSTPRDDPRLAGRGYQRSRSRSPPRRDSYQDNPYRDERRSDSRRGNYGRRSPSPERDFRGARDPPAGYRANEPDTETIRVKSSFVGLIIGRNGENLKKVEQETGSRVQFIQAKDSHVPERQCTISGTPRARSAAKTQIYTIIEENGGPNATEDKGAYTAGMPGRAKPNLPPTREGESTERIMVPDKTVGLIIGRGGETIKDLQEKSGCHVNILGENKSENGLRPINLIGTDQARQYAKELILEIVDSDSKGTSTNQTAPQRDRGYDNYGQQQQRDNGAASGGGGRDWIEKTINVPSEAVGMIIGKGGETIKDMQRTTGCKINVNQPQGRDVTRKIDLAGNSRSMADAERIIWEKVETVRQRDAARGAESNAGGGQGGGAGYGGYSQPQQQQQSVPNYGSYMPQAQTPQAPPQMPAFGMPMPQQQATAQQGADPNDPYAQYGGTQALYQWYAQQMANFGNQPQGGSGGAPGTQ